MQVHQAVIAKRTSLLVGKNHKRVYHPAGDYDRDALINVLCEFERLHGYKAKIIVMTSKQKTQLINHETAFLMGLIKDIKENDRVFGCEIEIDNLPPWNVVIEWQE